MRGSNRLQARSKLLVGFVLAALGALLFAGWRAYEAAVGGQAKPAALPRLAWPQAERQVFRLTYRSRDEARPIVEEGPSTAAADAIASRLELEALVAVTGEGAGGASAVPIIPTEGAR